MRSDLPARNSTLLQEDRLSLSRAARDCDVHPQTCGRWCSRGLRGITLESFLLGGRRYTTRQALGRFIERRSATSHSPPVPHTNRQREAAIKRAEESLKEAGL